MTNVRATIHRCRAGLKFVAPTFIRGLLIGTLLVILLPSLFSFLSLAYEKTSLGYSNAVSRGGWASTLLKPASFWTLIIVVFASVTAIKSRTLLTVIRRFWSFAVHDATFVWFVCTVSFWLEPLWSRRVFVLLSGTLITYLIAYVRSQFIEDDDPAGKIDQPIRNLKEDRLKREQLVESLYERLIDDGAPVIALTGAFGDGKTSILNCLQERLQEQGVVFVNFKSSLPSDDATLAVTLFNSIANQLGTKFFVRKLRNELRRFGKTFSGFMPSMFSPLKELFAEPSQQELIQELTERLSTLPVRRVVVILDDMDRMLGNELRTLLKIIRATEDYPKLSFVCAFNKRALVDALVRHQVINRVSLKLTSSQQNGALASGNATGEFVADDTRSGYEYLEKFFPIQIPVPKPDDGQIAEEFDRRFNEFAKRAGLSTLPEDTAKFNKEFQETYWKRYFLKSLGNFRKISLYFHALGGSFSLVKDEVNLADFMCIELIRQIEPEIYEQIYRNRSTFYHPEMDILRWDERDDVGNPAQADGRRHAIYDEVFRSVQGLQREFIVGLLGHLFPRMRTYEAAQKIRHIGQPSEGQSDQKKRIYHPDHFPTYFSLHVQEGYISSHELQTVIARANRESTVEQAQRIFIDYLRSLPELKRYRFFEKMAHYEGKIPAKPLAYAIAVDADKLSRDDFDFGEFGTAVRLILALANRLKDTDEMTGMLSNVISQSTSDAFVQRVFHFSTDRENNQIFQSWDHLNDQELKVALANRMRAKYKVDGNTFIYSPTRSWKEYQGLLSWARVSETERECVEQFLEYEFENHPSSIGMHVLWLTPSIEHPEGVKVVDGLFPLRRLAELAVKHGTKAYSNSEEENAVKAVIKSFGKPPADSRPKPDMPRIRPE